MIDHIQDLCDDAYDDELTLNKATLGQNEQTTSLKMRVALV